MKSDRPQPTMMSPAEAFPNLQAVDRERKPVQLPEAFLGKRTILFIAFHAKALSMIESWLAAFGEKFAGRRDLKHFILLAPAKAVQDDAFEPIRKINSALVVEGAPDSLKRFVAFQQPETPYVVVLSDKGILAFLASGEPGKNTWARFTRVLEPA
ncbi:MAG: hypothetical protein JO317_03650 [Verrucomicrobiae bacterium]|nr:hypothetical protein [Verrucomicrobiae bacterium]